MADGETRDGYAIRESPRAKHVRLKVSLVDGSVTVIAPRGCDPRHIHEFVRKRQAWIERTRNRVAAERRAAQTSDSAGLPTLIGLQAVGEDWRVEYRAGCPPPGREPDGDQKLIVWGAVDSEAGCRQALMEWLGRMARARLAPWLEELSAQHGLPVRRVVVRSQRTRWGSCSDRRTINLNKKLLFLPRRLVEQVLLHELCHLVHLNHSEAFWKMLRRLSPECDALEKELRDAWRYVPAWVER